MQRQLKADGYKTMQAWIAEMVKQHLKQKGANRLGDHPVIHNIETTGYPDGNEPVYPKCPVCGEEADTFYKTDYGNIVGCDNCITKVDAWDDFLEME